MTLSSVFGLVGIILLGLLVGVAIPAILQLRATLKSLQMFLDQTRPRFDEALAQTTEAVSRINRVGGEAEVTLGRLRVLLDAIGEARAPLLSVRDALRRLATVASALAPAVAAGFTALWGSRSSSGSGQSAPGGGGGSEP